MKVSTYAFMLFQLNDAEKTIFSKEDLCREIRNHSILEFLKEQIKYFDDSYPVENDRKKFLDDLENLLDACIDHKLCRSSNGRIVLIAYILELMQQDISEQMKSLQEKL